MRSDILPWDASVDKIAKVLYPKDGPVDICPVKGVTRITEMPSENTEIPP